MQTFKRVALGLGALLVIFGVLVLWKFPEQEVKRLTMDYEVQSPEEILLKHEAQIFEDRAVLEGVDLFRPSKGERDAGPYLNPLVHWDNQGPSKLQLPKELVAGVKGKDWVAFEPDFKAQLVDFSWMEKLHDFDYWAPDMNNPYIRASDKPIPHTLPFPGYAELTSWAKLRLIHGRKTKTMQKALTDVRQLARLIFTNDYLVSSMVTIGLLRAENMFVQNYNPKIFAGWKTIPEDVLVRAKRYFWAQSEFVDPRLSDETYERFSSGNVGQCQMISEGMLKNLIVRDHLKITYPGALRRFSGTVKNSLSFCRKTLLHMMWEDPEWKVFGKNPDYEKSLVKPENESDWKLRFLMIHPRVDQIFGLTMLASSTPNYLRQYQELPPKKSED